MKTCVILQSNYIPWRGYFDLIHDADVFVFLDDVQYTHSDWRSRNRIQTAVGPKWLTIPAGRNLNRLICEVEIADQAWKRKHRRAIEQHYRGAPYLAASAELLDALYESDHTNLSDLNQHAIRRISADLGIETEFVDSRSLPTAGRRTEKLISIVHAVGASRYISGPAAKAYIDPDQFSRADIELVYKDYPSYPVYGQLHGPFEPSVSILDAILNLGPDARSAIWPD